MKATTEVFLLNREELVQQLRAKYIKARVHKVEPEFIQYEESKATLEDLSRLLSTPVSSMSNVHNSALLYILGITDEIDLTRNVDTIDGSFCDIDLDFETQGYSRIIEWVNNKYGQAHVANIGTTVEFKPRGTVHKFFNATAPKTTDPNYEYELMIHHATQNEILAMIPPPLFGKEPTLEECINGNKDKGYEPHPELATNPKYKPWYETAKKLEGMVSTTSVHAAGLIVCDLPITDISPVSYKKDKDKYTKEEIDRYVTQFTKEEVESLGLQKFDFLRIENLSIVKQCCLLIKERHGLDINIYELPDGDSATYDLIASGNLGGVFQLETSESTRSWARMMKPRSLGETSDLLALVRPGPVQAGLTKQYVINKENGYYPEELHPVFAEVFKDSYWVLTYQEQLQELLAVAAGFTLEEADDVRRAVGKKQTKKLEPSRDAFINGCVSKNIDREYATEFWDEVIIGCADYMFNKSHSVAYSYLAYICAYLKANYPIEFFTALLSVRSQVMQPLDWSNKAPGFIQEARLFGITTHTPDINRSAVGFTIGEQGKTIHFGLSSIRKVGVGTAEKITIARGNTPFKSIKDFLSRVDKQKVNTGVFTNLVLSGCFDSLGYERSDLIENVTNFYEWFKTAAEVEERTSINQLRVIQNEEITRLIQERDEIRKRVKKKDYEPTDYETQFLEQHKRLALHRALAVPELPEFPTLARHKQLTLSIQDLLTQGELIGCYLPHPGFIAFPRATPIGAIRHKDDYDITGIVGEIKTYNNARGSTTYLTINDGTGSLRVPIYANNKLPIPKKGELVCIRVTCGVHQQFDEEGENISLKVFRTHKLQVYRG